MNRGSMASLKQIDRLIERGDVSGLCKALGDRNLQVQRRAVRGLAGLSDPASVPALLALLKRETDQYLIQWGLAALGDIDDEAAVHGLIDALFDTRRLNATQATQALSHHSSELSTIALQVRDALVSNDWAALGSLDGEASVVLEHLMRSPQYEGWPAGKRKKLTELAVRLGASPPAKHSDELADIGVFVSGVHSLGDVLKGLKNQGPRVRISAAQRLGVSGLKIAVGPLWRRFRQEVQPGGHAEAASAMARALEQLEDNRAIMYYAERLHSGGTEAPQAARGLALVGTRRAIDALFWFVAEPPPPPAYRNVSAVQTALEGLGPRAVDILSDYVSHPAPSARRVMARLVANVGHRDATLWLDELGRDPDGSVQIAAVHGLAKLNTAQAAQTLRELAGIGPREEIVKALAHITDPAGPEYLRALRPDATTLHGLLLNDHREPMAGASVELMGEHYYGGTVGWRWEPVSARMTIGEAGVFAFSLLDLGHRGKIRMKVLPPEFRRREVDERYLVDLNLLPGHSHRVEARFDAFVGRLLVRVDVQENGLLAPAPADGDQSDEE